MYIVNIIYLIGNKILSGGNSSLSKVNEQKKIRDEIYKLNCTLEASKAQKCAIVRFSFNPWISLQEPETQVN